MKENKLIEILRDLGLSEHEAGVYLAALSLGPSTIARIAKAAEIKRTTVYSVVDALQTRGLMNVEVRGLKKFFAASNPEKLDSILDLRKEKLKTVLPDFAALYNLKGGESFIKYYQGIEAIKNVYEGLIKDVRPHEDYLIISDQKRWYEIDEKFFEDFSRRRAKLPINIRMLLVDSDVARLWKEREKMLNIKVKFLPQGTALSTNLVIIPERVVVQQLTPPIFAMVIENQSTIQMFQQMFEILWKSIPEEPIKK